MHKVKLKKHDLSFPKSVVVIAEGKMEANFFAICSKMHRQLAINTISIHYKERKADLRSLSQHLSHLQIQSSTIFNDEDGLRSHTIVLGANASTSLNVPDLCSLTASLKDDFIQQILDRRKEKNFTTLNKTLEEASWVNLIKCFQRPTLDELPNDIQTLELILLKQIRLIKKLLAGFKKKLTQCHVIDIRQTFRNKIRFLFKNMEDCSDNNIMIDHIENIILLIRTTFNNEKNRMYKTLAKFA